MAEYIEREALIAKLLSHAFTDDLYGMGLSKGLEIATATAKRMPYKEIPTADVEEVTRCKDCRQSCYVSGMFGESLFCTYWNRDTDENGYCHEGG